MTVMAEHYCVCSDCGARGPAVSGPAAEVRKNRPVWTAREAAKADGWRTTHRGESAPAGEDFFLDVCPDCADVRWPPEQEERDPRAGEVVRIRYFGRWWPARIVRRTGRGATCEWETSSGHTRRYVNPWKREVVLTGEWLEDACIAWFGRSFQHAAHTPGDRRRLAEQIMAEGTTFEHGALAGSLFANAGLAMWIERDNSGLEEVE